MASLACCLQDKLGMDKQQPLVMPAAQAQAVPPIRSAALFLTPAWVQTERVLIFKPSLLPLLHREQTHSVSILISIWTTSAST